MLDWLRPKQAVQPERKKIKIIPLSDLHTGSSTALFPYYDGTDLGYEPHKNMTGDGGWKFKHMKWSPTAKQYKMFQHFTRCAEQIAQSRSEYKFIVVENGDGIDGKHHETPQLATRQISEQVQVHTWLMKYFLHKIGFSRTLGDALYIGAGTEVHDGDEEDNIAVQLGADVLPNGEDAFDFLPMDANGRRLWFLHQGASAGRGLSTGNALHNWMKNQYFQSLEDGRVIPDIVMSGHYHRSVYDTFTRNDRTIHGIILPPFQLKTRFGNKVAAAELEEVGIRTIDINEAGDIRVNKAMTIKSFDEVVTV